MACQGPDFTTHEDICLMSSFALELLYDEYRLYSDTVQINGLTPLYDPTQDLAEARALIQQGIAKLAVVKACVEF